VAGLLGLALRVAAATAEEPSSGVESLMTWAEGPVRWLLLPSDWREIKSIDDPAAALNFIESFWRLRDPDPGSDDNSFRATFSARVEAADLLYSDGPTRGSLTDRGRALVLLGPPPHMRLTTEQALAWKPGRRSSQRSTRREIRVEEWLYPEDELPDKLVRVLRAAGQEPSLEIKFRLGRHGATLAEGENSLILAARLALVQD
jgi:GWxTD domain-containing protein